MNNKNNKIDHKKVFMKLTDDFRKKSKISDIGRYYINAFVSEVSKKLPLGSSILDAGAGECAYKEYFSHCRYFSVDLAVGNLKWNYKNLDIIGRLDELPIVSECFDAILCTQALEHLNKPLDSLNELYRALKKGGYLFLTAPMSQPEHQIPYDFYRYTSYGLRYLCAAAGFKVIKTSPCGGTFVRWAYELPRSLKLFPPFKTNKITFLIVLLLATKVVYFIMLRIIQFFLLALDRFDKDENDTLGWCIIAKK